MPSNYVKIKNKSFYAEFDKFFYQRWDFFAPPPKTNYRLYFQYKSASSSEVEYKIEVMKDLLKQKSAKAPFNSYEEMMDYQLYGCVNIITTILSDLTKQQQYISPDSTGIYHANKSIEKYNEQYSNGPEMLSLIQYAKLCAYNMGFYDEMVNPQLKIMVCTEDIPGFSKQFNYTVQDTTTTIQENLVFISDYKSI